MPQVPVLLTFDNLFLHLHPPSKPPFHHPTSVTLERHSSPQSQSNLQGEYLEQSQRSRTPSEKGALLVASNAQQRQTLARAQRGRARNAQKAARKAARGLESGYESLPDQTQAEHTHLPRPHQPRGDACRRPTLQQVIRSYATAQLSRELDHPLDLPTHSPRLPPPSVHGSLTVISSSQPVATGSGITSHIRLLLKARQMTRLINANQSRAKRPWIEHALSDTKTTPLSQQDPQVPPEDTQTVPEDLEVDQVNIQTVPKTSTQHPVSDIAARYEQVSSVSQPAPPTGTQPEPINVADGLPPTRGSVRGGGARARARARARGSGPGRTRTRGGRGRGSAVRVGEGLHVMSPGERAIPRNLGIRREGALVVPAPTLPDISLQRNSQSIGIASQPRTQTPSASQQTSNPPNRPPTAPAPRTTPGPSNINQPDRAPTTPRVSGTRPPTGNRQPPPKTLAGPSLSSLTRPNLPYLANRWAIQGKHPARAQVAALISSNPIVTRPTPENGAELVLDDDEEQAAEAAVAQGREPNHRRRKPSSRNTHGVSRLVLQLAKLHFWAYALAEGPYQTRAVFITWVRVLVAQDVADGAPGTPFRDITDEEIQVVIAGLVTKRGRAKEQLRSAIEFLLGFNRFAMTPEEEQEPERRGHYESELMHHAFALALFHNEGAVGVVFSEYFEDLAPATVAFILANFRRTAPRRARALTREWFEYGLHYSNATQPVEEQGLLPSQVAEFRANTPTAEEPNQSDRTLNEQVAYTQQIQELGLDEEFDEGRAKRAARGLYRK
ncbi:hypothetical protein RHS01_10917 [Rhizoctonia solani]|uniref:DUF6532 domain-containing protein n=1 Tax=Rhizoctonia solani TaxID=456999 RepID=A0A8H7I2L9_9AGAM|nr:hypothetical protein RHS01_10917 [Rhizoctonia solani]